MALTRSKARKLANELCYSREPSEVEVIESESLAERVAQQESNASVSEITETYDGDSGVSQDPEGGPSERVSEGELQTTVLAPTAPFYEQLLNTDREAFIAEQKSDPSLQVMAVNSEEGVASKNITFQERQGLLYRKYEDKRGRKYDQIVVPERYRKGLLALCHNHA